MFEELGVTRDRVYITNVVKCRPPNNRDPEPDEISTCNPWLEQQLDLIDPKVIVTLGRPATSVLLGRDISITRIRGVWQEYRSTPVMPTFHPAYLLRNPEAKREVWADLQAVLKQLGRTPPPTGRSA